MIILDTNVLGELVRIQPNQRVVNWIDHVDRADLVTTAVTVAEMKFGVERLPLGRRKTELARLNDSILATLASILPFSRSDAEIFGSLVATALAQGRDLKPLDAQIAAIAMSYGATLATRNTRDFEHVGLDLINPWTV